VVTDSLNELLRPIRARRAELADDRAYLRDVVREGNRRAREIAAATLGNVRELMHMSY
jgi:tryptophanyl-tRNA synthetase